MPLALVLLILLATGVALGRLPLALTFAYAGMGVVSLAAYYSDKRYAAAGHWRISETTLLAMDLCLGIMGGLTGQALFRHKTRKPGYVARTLMIAGVHLLWLAALASGLVDANQLVGEGARLLGLGQ